MTEAPKFCKDCKWVRLSFSDRLVGLVGFGGYSFAKCGHLAAARGNTLVTDCGGFYCSTERAFSGGKGCGPEGKNWEPK